jgi:hypothetical protein
MKLYVSLLNEQSPAILPFNNSQYKTSLVIQKALSRKHCNVGIALIILERGLEMNEAWI